MNERKRMPALVIDEVLLLVDAYFEMQNIFDVQAKKSLVEQLSINMRRLPFYPEERQNPEFRSVSGMNMCLANIGYVDPNNSSRFGHGSELQRKVFSYFVDKRELLHKLVKAILSIYEKKIPLDYSFENSMTGILLPSYHLYLERKNKIIMMVNGQMVENAKTLCSACGLNLDNFYKGIGCLIETHIDLPLYKNNANLVISPSELVGLCPTCHKLLHSRPDLYEVKQLEKYIKQ